VGRADGIRVGGKKEEGRGEREEVRGEREEGRGKNNLGLFGGLVEK
jgi:hypothetical protein